MKKNKLIIIASVIVIIIMVGIAYRYCIKNNKKSNKMEILYSNIAEIAIFNKTGIDNQLIQIPLIVSDKIDSLTVKNCVGENVNVDVISGRYDYCAEYKDKYCYIIYLEYDPNNVLAGSGDGIISSLELEIDNDLYTYDFGTFRILERDRVNNEHISFLKVGTGYSNIRQLDMELSINADVEITEISTTLGFDIIDKEKYLRKYSNGSELKIHKSFSEETMETIDKLYYCYNAYVEYRYEDESFRYDVIIFPIQTDIGAAFEQFVDSRK